MNKLFQMFWSFFKIGAFTFGGGYAMIPIIEAEVVDKRGWISKEDFMDILVVSQSFPGVLAVNCSTFIGYKLGGIIGAVMALIGATLPSFLIILIVATFFTQIRDNPIVDLIFKGISAAVPMLVLIAVVSLSKSLKKDVSNFSVIIVSVILITVFKVHPIFIILLSALYGIIFLRKKVQ